MTDASNTQPDTGTELLDDVKQAASDAIVTALKIYQPILLNGITAMQSVPSLSEVPAAAAQVESSILTTFPQLAQAEIQALAADAKTALTQLGTAAATAAQGLAPSASTVAQATGTQSTAGSSGS